MANTFEVGEPLVYTCIYIQCRSLRGTTCRSCEVAVVKPLIYSYMNLNPGLVYMYVHVCTVPQKCTYNYVIVYTYTCKYNVYTCTCVHVDTCALVQVLQQVRMSCCVVVVYMYIYVCRKKTGSRG